MTVDKMHLRLGRIHPLVGFLNIPQIFAGSYRDKSDRFGCIDFIGGDFEVEVLGLGERERISVPAFRRKCGTCGAVQTTSGERASSLCEFYGKAMEETTIGEHRTKVIESNRMPEAARISTIDLRLEPTATRASHATLPQCAPMSVTRFPSTPRRG
jgi:hypothetical protein